jgi:hypothetical protein
VKSEPGPAATLGSTAAASVRIIVWCKACGHQTEPANGRAVRGEARFVRPDGRLFTAISEDRILPERALP